MDSGSGDGEVAALPKPAAPHEESHVGRAEEHNQGGQNESNLTSSETGQDFRRDRNTTPNLRQDMNIMEQKKRVSMILQSPVFCDALESLIHDQLRKGNNPTSLLALQQIADFMTAGVPTVCPAAPQGGMSALSMSLGMVTPVNDLRGSESIAYEKAEKLLRCKLAAFYRLTDVFGWSQLIYNHITVRLSSEPENFLIVPFGLLYSEVTASSLVKLNLQGEMVDRGSTNLGVNQAGFALHSAIYAARPDVKCIVHIHTPAGAAVSAMKCGLLPISPEALSLGEVAYHNYHGILVQEEEIQKSLGPKSKVLILRNRGLVSVGDTVEEAFYYIHNLVTACEIQVRTLATMGGPDNLVMLDPEKYKARLLVSEGNRKEDDAHPKWQRGEQEFEALMRMLDNLGYRTGYPYRYPALRERGKKHSTSEVPLSAAGLSCVGDGGPRLQAPPKSGFRAQQSAGTAGPPAGRPGKAGEEGPGGCGGGGGTGPKAQWSKDDSYRPPVVANQFVPLNTNPKEVRDMRNKIREQNLQDVKTAGPQSQLLYGAVVERGVVQRETIWQDAPLSDCTDTIDGLDLSEQTNSPAKSIRKGELVTASKAIIRKEYQPCVIVNKTGPNPFNKLTDRELEEYCREVERKQRDANDHLLETEKEAKDEILNQSSNSAPLKAEEDHLLETEKEAKDEILNQSSNSAPLKAEEDHLLETEKEAKDEILNQSSNSAPLKAEEVSVREETQQQENLTAASE